MGILGLAFGAGKALLGGGKKKQTGPRMARRMFRREGGRDLGEQEAPEQQQAQPTTPLVPMTFSSSPERIDKSVPNKGGSETLEGTAFRIKTSVVQIDTLLKGSLLLDKMREKRRIKNEQARRDREEKELEKNKSKSPGLKKLLPKGATDIWSRISNYFVTLFWGFIIMRLVNNIGLFTRLAQFAIQAANFIINWGGKFLNFIVSFIDGAYGVVDTVKSAVGTLFGQVGIDAFEKLSKTFVMLLNAALIAAMVSARVNMGLNRAAGARLRNPGFWGPPTGKDISRLTKGKVPVTTGRGGTRGGVNPFRRRAPVTGGGRAPLIRGARPRVTSGGKAGLQALKGPWKTSAAPIIKRIPLVGALMDFGINVFLFGESPGRAGFKAIGTALGSSILGALGSIIPGVGTLIGLIGGGIIGDMLGGWLYDRIFGQRISGVGEKVSDNIAADAISGAISAGAGIWGASKIVQLTGRRGTSGIKGKTTTSTIPKTKTKPRTKPMRTLGRRVGVSKGLGGGAAGIKDFAKKNWLTAALFSVFTFMDRKSMGQTNVQAGVGTGAEVAGSAGGAALGTKIGMGLGAAAGGAIGSLFGGVGAVPGAAIGTKIGGVLGMLVGGIGGAMAGGAGADALTGANKPKPGGEEEAPAWSSMPGVAGLGGGIGGTNQGVQGVFHKGGIVPMDMSAFLQGGEIVIDVDSAEPAKDMLLAINEASGYEGVMDAISQYAPYEQTGEKVVVVQTSPPAPTPPNDSLRSLSSTLQWSAGGKFMGGGSDFDPFEILHKGV